MIDLFRAFQVFVLITKTGSFSAASREANSSQTAVTRLVGQLEAHFGLRLFHRSTRRIALTEDGQELLGYARRLLEVADEMENALGRQRDRPTGLVRVGLPSASAELLAPRMGALFERYPEISVDLVVRDHCNHLVDDRLDVALQMEAPSDASLVTRVVTSSVSLLVGSPVYLKQYAAPNHPADLANHRCLIHDTGPDSTVWRFEGPNGVTHVHVTGPLRATNAVAVRRAALAGYGISMLPEPFVLNDIRSGRLHWLLPDYPLERGKIYLVYPTRQHLPPRTRVVIDFLVEYTRLLNKSELTNAAGLDQSDEKLSA